MKNLLTLLGGIFTATGPIITTQVPYAHAYWIGMIIAAIGGVLLGSRGMFDDKPKT